MSGRTRRSPIRMPAVSPAPSAADLPICVDSKVDHYCRNEEADYFICRQCELIFQHPLPARTSMVEWADDAYASGAYRDYVEARPMKIRHFEDRLADVGARHRGRDACSTWAVPADTSWKSPPRAVSTCTVWSSRAGAIAAASPEMRPRIFEGVLEGHARQRTVRCRQRVRSDRARAGPQALPQAMCAGCSSREAR